MTTLKKRIWELNESVLPKSYSNQRSLGRHPDDGAERDKNAEDDAASSRFD